MTNITNIDDNELRELLIKNLPSKIKAGTDKTNANYIAYPSKVALDKYKFINFNTKQAISFMVFDIDEYNNQTALEYFKDVYGFLEYITEIVGLEPTYILQTDKGFHFAYHLKNWVYTHQNKAVYYLREIKKAITDAAQLDASASNRISGVWRNPLLHNYYYSSQINYELKDFKDLLPKQVKKYKHKKSTGKLFVKKDFKEGERNRGLFYNAMRYAKYQDNTSVDDIFQFIQAINIELDIPLDEEEVFTISRMVYKYKTNNRINERFGRVDTVKKDINEGAMEFPKMHSLTKEEYSQETKNRQIQAAKRTVSIRDKEKNKVQLKKAREEYINKKYLDNERQVKDTINHFMANNKTINVSKIAKECGLNRRLVTKVIDTL